MEENSIQEVSKWHKQRCKDSKSDYCDNRRWLIYILYSVLRYLSIYISIYTYDQMDIRECLIPPYQE